MAHHRAARDVGGVLRPLRGDPCTQAEVFTSPPDLAESLPDFRGRPDCKFSYVAGIRRLAGSAAGVDGKDEDFAAALSAWILAICCFAALIRADRDWIAARPFGVPADTQVIQSFNWIWSWRIWPSKVAVGSALPGTACFWTVPCTGWVNSFPTPLNTRFRYLRTTTLGLQREVYRDHDSS